MPGFMSAPGFSSVVRPAARSRPGIWRIFMTSFSIAISWISTTPATGDSTATRRALAEGVRRMKAPEAFCVATVPRTQASSTLTVVCAQAPAVTASSEAMSIFFMMTPVGFALKKRKTSDQLFGQQLPDVGGVVVGGLFVAQHHADMAFAVEQVAQRGVVHGVSAAGRDLLVIDPEFVGHRLDLLGAAGERHERGVERGHVVAQQLGRVADRKSVV